MYRLLLSKGDERKVSGYDFYRVDEEDFYAVHQSLNHLVLQVIVSPKTHYNIPPT